MCPSAIVNHVYGRALRPMCPRLLGANRQQFPFGAAYHDKCSTVLFDAGRDIAVIGTRPTPQKWPRTRHMSDTGAERGRSSAAERHLPVNDEGSTPSVRSMHSANHSRSDGLSRGKSQVMFVTPRIEGLGDGRLKTCTPALATEVWQAMANPSTRRVATKLRQSGGSHTTEALCACAAEYKSALIAPL